MKYVVHVFQKVLEEAWVTIEADTQQQAEELAIKEATENDVGWQFNETISDIKVVGVREL